MIALFIQLEEQLEMPMLYVSTKTCKDISLGRIQISVGVDTS